MTNLEQIALKEILQSNKNIKRSCEDALCIFYDIDIKDLSQETLFFFEDQADLLQKRVSKMIPSFLLNASVVMEVHLDCGTIHIDRLSFSNISWETK